MRVGLGCLLLAAPLGALLGCDLPENPARARLWTLDDYVALSQGRGEAQQVPPLPESISMEKLLVDAGNGRYRLVLAPTLEGGYRAAYVTTDLWQGFDEIWVQPLFFLVKGWTDNGSPLRFMAPDPRARPIFSVGTKSRFYSPYWQTHYVKIPEETPSERYRSMTDILSDRTLEIRASDGLTASLLSADVAIDPPPDPNLDINPNLPLPAQIGPTVVRGTGYLDGVPVDYLDFGKGGFQWNKQRVVEEIPLYDLTLRDASGRWRSLGAPKLGGAGPPYSNRQPLVAGNGRPLYGAYWRLYDVRLPDSARIVAPRPFFADYADALKAAGLPVGDLVDPKDGTKDSLRPYVGQVVLDEACLANPTALGECTSRLTGFERLENILPASALIKTDLTVTCPFVSYNKLPVPNP